MATQDIAVPPRTLSAWQQWAQRPQNLWLRRALFQVHLWIGIGIGLYILVISVSGSAVVYRREIFRKYSRGPVAVAVTGPKLSQQEMQQDAQRLYPAYQVVEVYQPRRADLPASITMKRGTKRIERYFNPYTGADLGSPISTTEATVQWLVDLHDNLLAGQTGRLVNGIGSILVTIMALTGMVIWWPGIKNWRRSMSINWKASFTRFNWDTHSALGFWFCLFILMWSISGIYFSFPDPFNALLSDGATFWLSSLHFGRFGWFTRIVWTIFGLVPAFLFVTGFLMWWNRVVRKRGKAV
jgi:uncharacterized iron-regulated membrane protein